MTYRVSTHWPTSALHSSSTASSLISTNWIKVWLALSYRIKLYVEVTYLWILLLHIYKLYICNRWIFLENKNCIFEYFQKEVRARFILKDWPASHPRLTASYPFHCQCPPRPPPSTPRPPPTPRIEAAPFVMDIVFSVDFSEGTSTCCCVVELPEKGISIVSFCHTLLIFLCRPLFACVTCPIFFIDGGIECLPARAIRDVVLSEREAFVDGQSTTRVRARTQYCTVPLTNTSDWWLLVWNTKETNSHLLNISRALTRNTIRFRIHDFRSSDWLPRSPGFRIDFH